MEKVLENYVEKITADTLTENISREAIANPVIEKEIEINGEKITVQIAEV